jgi:hypothetical protein
MWRFGFTVRGMVLGGLTLLAVHGLSGCAGYRLGPTNGLEAREKSVLVQPFANQTLEPRLTDPVTSQLRKQIQRDGTFQLATSSASDVVITGVITRYQRAAVTLVPNDLLTVQDYRLSLTAQVTARERASGRVLFDQPVTGFTIIQVGNDLTSAERQALPLLAGDLARNVTGLLVDGKW